MGCRKRGLGRRKGPGVLKTRAVGVEIRGWRSKHVVGLEIRGWGVQISVSKQKKKEKNIPGARDVVRLEPQLLLLPLLVAVLLLIVEVAVGLVLRWRGHVWQETPTSHDDSLVVVVGVVVGDVCISSL